MTKFAHYDKTGRIVGFFDDTLHDEIPEPHVEVSEKGWQGHVDGVTPLRVNPKTKALVEYTPPPPSLDVLKKEASTTISRIASRTVLAIGGNPSADEIASWPEKVTASKAVLAGQDFDAVPLAPTMRDHGVDIKGAAQIILLKARLYRLAKAAAEIIANGAKLAVGAADEQDEIDAAVENFNLVLEARQAQFSELRADATQGDLGKLEAAEAEIIGG